MTKNDDNFVQYCINDYLEYRKQFQNSLFTGFCSQCKEENKPYLTADIRTMETTCEDCYVKGLRTCGGTKKDNGEDGFLRLALRCLCWQTIKQHMLGNLIIADRCKKLHVLLEQKLKILED